MRASHADRPHGTDQANGPDVKTAIIVNDRGEAFTGWHSACDISASGMESYRSVASFSKPRTVLHPRLQRQSGEFISYWPLQGSKRLHYTAGKPYVFVNRRAAEKALRRMHCFARLAVVD